MLNSWNLSGDTYSFEQISHNDFVQKVLMSEKPVIVEFTVDWCGPCLQMKDTLRSLSKEFIGRIKFYSMEVKRNDGLSKQYDVYLLPTLVFFRNGAKVDFLSGTNSYGSINKKLLSLLTIKKKK